MNPLTNMKNIKKLSEQDLEKGYKSTWHEQYRRSAWIYVGGLSYDLSEGDIICIFSQYGEIVNINLVRDKDTGKSKGFCFICYEDQRSTDLAVDNFNGIKIVGRTIRVDHVSEYKVPKEGKNTDEETKQLYREGCAPTVLPPPMPIPQIKTEPTDVRETLADQISAEIRLPPRLPIQPVKKEPLSDEEKQKVKSKEAKKSKKDKKEKKDKKHKKKRRQHSSSDSDSDNESIKFRKKNKMSHGSKSRSK